MQPPELRVAESYVAAARGRRRTGAVRAPSHPRTTPPRGLETATWGHAGLRIPYDEIIDRPLAIQALAGHPVTMITYEAAWRVYHADRRLSSRATTETIELNSTTAQYAFQRYVRTGLLFVCQSGLSRPFLQ